MLPGFPPELADHAGNILLVWTFVNTFADSLGALGGLLHLTKVAALLVSVGGTNKLCHESMLPWIARMWKRPSMTCGHVPT